MNCDILKFWILTRLLSQSTYCWRLQSERVKSLHLSSPPAEETAQIRAIREILGQIILVCVLHQLSKLNGFTSTENFFYSIFFLSKQISSKFGEFSQKRCILRKVKNCDNLTKVPQRMCVLVWKMQNTNQRLNSYDYICLVFSSCHSVLHQRSIL